ncbi:MAG: hypothetical protein R6W66_07320 [Pelovirga sp.]
MIDQQPYPRLMLCRQADHCATHLRLLLGDPAARQVVPPGLVTLFTDLQTQAGEQGVAGLSRIAERIVRSLQHRAALSPHLLRIDDGNLALAADWLEQLSQICRARLPEPQGLIADLIYSFDLVEQAAQVPVSGAAAVGEMPQGLLPHADLFADDPALVTEFFSSRDVAVDPFAEDPGFGALLDLLQRTLHHAVGLRKDPVSDPFASDPALTEDTAVAVGPDALAGAAAIVADLFDGDPVADDNPDDPAPA